MGGGFTHKLYEEVDLRCDDFGREKRRENCGLRAVILQVGDPAATVCEGLPRRYLPMGQGLGSGRMGACARTTFPLVRSRLLSLSFPSLLFLSGDAGYEGGYASDAAGYGSLPTHHNPPPHWLHTLDSYHSYHSSPPSSPLCSQANFQLTNY